MDMVGFGLLDHFLMILTNTDIVGSLKLKSNHFKLSAVYTYTHVSAQTSG